MQVREAMTKEFISVPGDTTVDQAAVMMRDHDIGMLPVISMDGKIAGVLTDRDITVRAVAEGEAPDATIVSDLLSPGVQTCREEDDLEQVAEHMAKAHLRRLPVLNGDGELSGILGLADVARHIGATKVADTLTTITEQTAEARLNA